MKTIIKTSLMMLTGIIMTSQSFSQNINWRSLKPEDKHIININAGFEHGLLYGLGYGNKINMIIPIVWTIEYSMPSGENLSDDFKSKAGIKARLVEVRNFIFSANIYGIYRRYENNLVRMQNFGSDFTGVAGFYKLHWFIAVEAGFDKAIVTHLKHSKYYKEIFPAVKNGWYEPSTGGNFYYGLQTGFSFRQHDFYLNAGRMLTQDFKTKPTVPYYVEMGYNLKIKSR
jgi:hypothetical protein